MEKRVEEIIAQRRAQANESKYIGPMYLIKSSFKRGIIIGNKQLEELEKNRPKGITEEIEEKQKEILKIMYKPGINREVNSYYLGLITSYSYYLSRGKIIK